MAIYNEILVGRFAKSLQRIFSMKGEVPSKQLSGEVMPVLPFPALDSAELRFLEGWDRYASGLFMAGNAAQFSAVQLRNPPGSNVMAVIEQIVVSETAADVSGPTLSLQWTTDLGNLGTIVGPVKSLDARGRRNHSVVTSRQQLGAVTPGGDASLWGQLNYTAGLASVIVHKDAQLPCAPGTTYRMQSQTANVGMLCAFVWRERALEESETI